VGLATLTAHGAASAHDHAIGAATGTTLATGASTRLSAPPGRVIVVLRRDRDRGPTSTARTATELGGTLGFRARRTFDPVLPAFAATLDRRQIAALRADPRVADVRLDRPLVLTAQTEPPGIRRVGARLAPATRIDGTDAPGDRVDADIAILDTGVDATHPDLHVVGGVDCSDHDGALGTPVGHPHWGDVDSGSHGTHVAGIAAAIDNGIGVVGVAPGARIWSVRIFGPDLRGWESNLLCGVAWVTDQRDGTRPRFEVANMSMRVDGDTIGGAVADDGACGRTDGDPLHVAMCASVDAGNVFTVAAGNERNDASGYIPAAYDEVITVSAMADFDGRPGGGAAAPAGCRDVDDTFADFSTRGADVDLVAPGVCVLSTLRRTTTDPERYGIISGTSMAAPAVAGGAALFRLSNPTASPAQVRAGLIAAGNRGWASETDPDGIPDRLLDVASAGAPASFALAVRPATRAIQPGTAGMSQVELSRSFSFHDPITLSLEGERPVGVTAELSATTVSEADAADLRLTIGAAAGTPDASVPLAIRATGGPGLTEGRVETWLEVDGTPPTVAAPVARFRRGMPAGAADVPLRVDWSGTDANGPLRYELARRTDAGAWSGVLLRDTAAAWTTDRAAPLHAYAYRVTASDAAGNRTSADGAAFRLVRRAESAPSIRYTGSWTEARTTGAFGGSARWASAAGASASLTFTGRAFAWFAPIGPDRGRAEVFADGALVETVDLVSTSPARSRAVFTIAWPGAATRHSVTIRVVGTAGRARVDLDELFFIR
jgi:hypothetical protein